MLTRYKPLPRVGVDPDGYRTHALMMHIVTGDDSVMAPSSESDLFGSSSDTDGGVNDLSRRALALAVTIHLLQVAFRGVPGCSNFGCTSFGCSILGCTNLAVAVNLRVF